MKFFKSREEKTPNFDSLLFSQDRQEIATQLELMTQKAVNMIQRAFEALQKGDAQLARQVVQSDQEVNRLEVDIENLCLRALALRQPVRDDLRFIFSVLKALTDLERIGDQAVNIAYRAENLAHLSLNDSLNLIAPMAELVTLMVHDALQALLTEDTALALDVQNRDDKVDAINHRNHAILLSKVRESSGNSQIVGEATELILASRNMERIGDHGSNIAERAYYAATGQRVKELRQND